MVTDEGYCLTIVYVVWLFFGISTNICNVTIIQIIRKICTICYKNTQDVPWKPEGLFPMGSMITPNSIVPKHYELTDYCCNIK